jgi:NADH dehydrogenase (ubiquinone) 1 beta subcomplex subunit 7
MKVHPQVLKDEQVPPQFRDFCAHLLVPLNRCRLGTGFLPWKCEVERHAYEHCEYMEYVRGGSGRSGASLGQEEGWMGDRSCADTCASSNASAAERSSRRRGRSTE